jgi:5-formyltetrahydrofolate cyclo-ligase
MSKGSIRAPAPAVRRPPAPLLDLIPANAVIGVYNAGRWKAPAASYAAFFHEAGHAVALPWFAARRADAVPPVAGAPLDEDLEADPWGVKQPRPRRK